MRSGRVSPLPASSTPLPSRASVVVLRTRCGRMCREERHQLEEVAEIQPPPGREVLHAAAPIGPPRLVCLTRFQPQVGDEGILAACHLPIPASPVRYRTAWKMIELVSAAATRPRPGTS